MRLILLGAPGSGKGTQAAALADHFGVPHISSGELLRRQVAAGTELGREVASLLERGELAPDRLGAAGVDGGVADAGRGYLLEGCPGTVAAAREAEARHGARFADAVVFLQVPDYVARRRLAGRTSDGRADGSDPGVIERRLR